jgi:hypothetical protein
MKRIILKLIHSCFLVTFVFCDPVFAEIWSCELTNSDRRWYSSNPVNSDKQKCVLRDAIGESRFTRANFHALKARAEHSDSTALSGKDAARQRIEPSAGEVSKRRAKFVLDWTVEEQRADRTRRGDVYSTAWCLIVGNIYGKGPRLVRVQIRRGGAKVDELTAYLSRSKSRATWKAKLKGRCRNLDVRAIPDD